MRQLQNIQPKGEVMYRIESGGVMLSLHKHTLGLCDRPSLIDCTQAWICR